MAESKNIFFNRELSWVEFNARVLHEAARKELPLMERLKFIAITSSNFDEFFQVRVASLKRQIREGAQSDDGSGLSPLTVMHKISERCHQLVKTQQELLSNDILPNLAREGFIYVPAEAYSIAQRSFTERLFHHEIFPVLTPQRTDSSEFPNIGNLRLSAAFLLKRMEGIHALESPLSTKQQEITALVQIPSGLPRVVWLPGNENEKHFTLIDDIIQLYGKELFPGYTVLETMLFKVARDADFAVNEEENSNFIKAMEEVLIKRQSSFAVRMVCTTTSQTLMETLKKALSLYTEDIYPVSGIMDPATLMDITKAEGAEKCLHPAWNHFYPDDLPEKETYWNTLRQHDVLLNFPYQSFDPVVKFIQDAARDQNVLAIKITLYRPGDDNPIVKALIEAAKNGKQVTVFIELKARFDEKRNISWASELENAGAIVIYGVVNLKVHAKICLVVRRESDGIRRYLNISTGNYNPKTACLYQDFSLLTSNHDLATDATLFFNVISGYSAVQTMHHLSMAPVTLKSTLLELIEREIKQSTSTRPGLIIAKMNSLCHKEIIEKLYQASQAGVQILLNVRGICTLKPGVPGLSENIKVVSIIDRYLEHSRIFYFQNGGTEELYMASADWMDRNLDRRIELMFPVTDKEAFKTAKECLMLYFQDNTHSHSLAKDGSWKLQAPGKKEQAVSAQDILYKKYKKKSDAKKEEPHVEFIVRRDN